MLKVSALVDGKEVAFDPVAAFTRQLTHRGTDARIVVTMPAGRADLLREISALFPGPYQVLYVLHSPRGEGKEGRYQSGEVNRADLEEFLKRFEPFLLADARCDIWVHPAHGDGLVVWDRHHELFVYGRTEEVIKRLQELGIHEGPHMMIGEHAHHFRPEFDDDAARILDALPWVHSELQPGDHQYVPGDDDE